MAYPYSRPETLADAIIHGVGLIASGIGCVALLAYVAHTQSAPEIVAVSVYAAFLVIAFVASALYHLLPFEGSRPWLHKIDHAAIYLKIAGTYTPLVIVLGGVFSYTVLGAVWVIAIAGAVAKLSYWKTDARGSLALYLAMGWAAVLLIWPMWTTLPGVALALIVAGGLLYTVGTVFFAARRLRFQNAIWHAFVLAASTCFFGAITTAVSA